MVDPATAAMADWHQGVLRQTRRQVAAPTRASVQPLVCPTGGGVVPVGDPLTVNVGVGIGGGGVRAQFSEHGVAPCNIPVAHMGALTQQNAAIVEQAINVTGRRSKKRKALPGRLNCNIVCAKCGRLKGSHGSVRSAMLFGPSCNCQHHGKCSVLTKLHKTHNVEAGFCCGITPQTFGLNTPAAQQVANSTQQCNNEMEGKI